MGGREELKRKRTRLVWLALLAIGIVGAAAGAARAGWGSAIEVPGTAGLNAGGYAQVSSISCATAHACVAGGWYEDGSSHVQAFVVGETDGSWGDAVEVPGTGALNFGDAEVTSVSCSAPGACVAGGFYADVSGLYQAFVVDETDGTWGDAVEVTARPTLIFRGGNVTSVSCSAPGACVAGGTYTSRPGHNQAFVVVETHGHWGRATRVRGMVYLNRGHDARVNSVSCGGPGGCVAGGHYTNRSGDSQAFVVDMKHGRWGVAVKVPGTVALNRIDAEVSSVSCAKPGACAAGGYYSGDSGNSQAFVVSETDGRWGNAVGVRGTRTTGAAQVESVSCAAAGTCVAGGYFPVGPRSYEAFVVRSTRGHWGYASPVRGLAALNYGDATVSSVSCGTASACAAGGRYQDGSGHYQAFVVSETNGHWGNAVQVPGLAALNGGDSQVNAVSCAVPGPCVAGGTYQDGSSGYQAFVATGP